MLMKIEALIGPSQSLCHLTLLRCLHQGMIWSAGGVRAILPIEDLPLCSHSILKSFSGSSSFSIIQNKHILLQNHVIHSHLGLQDALLVLMIDRRAPSVSVLDKLTFPRTKNRIWSQIGAMMTSCSKKNRDDRRRLWTNTPSPSPFSHSTKKTKSLKISQKTKSISEKLKIQTENVIEIGRMQFNRLSNAKQNHKSLELNPNWP